MFAVPSFLLLSDLLYFTLLSFVILLHFLYIYVFIFSGKLWWALAKEGVASNEERHGAHAVVLGQLLLPFCPLHLWAHQTYPPQTRTPNETRNTWQIRNSTLPYIFGNVVRFVTFNLFRLSDSAFYFLMTPPYFLPFFLSVFISFTWLSLYLFLFICISIRTSSLIKFSNFQLLSSRR